MTTAVITAVALAAVTGTTALAQTYRPANDGGPMITGRTPQASGPRISPRTRATMAYARQNYGTGYDAYASAPELSDQQPGVYAYGRYLGWDPDPNIRFQLRRDFNQGN